MQDQDRLPRMVHSTQTAVKVCHGSNSGNIIGGEVSYSTLIGQQTVHNYNETRRNGEALAWLSSLDYSAKQKEFKSMATPNTGQWLLNSTEFVDWRSKESQKLWCVGMPGAGKTILASIVIDHLQEPKFKSSNQQPAIAYLYLTYKNQPSLENLLGSVARQLLDPLEDLPPSLVRLWNNQRYLFDSNAAPQRHLSLTEVHEILAEVTENRQVYIVVDALDEYTPSLRSNLVDHLRKIREGINLLVTSRLLGNLESMSQGFKRLDVAAKSQDIHKYIDYAIESDGRLQNMVAKYPELREDIKHKVTDKSSEMFLLARLHMNAIAAEVRPYSLRKKLQHLPESPDTTYSDAMARVKAQKEEVRRYAIEILSWIVYAFRPLSVQELLHALAVEKGDIQIDEEKMLLKKDLEEFCCGLVVIDSETETVRLVHYTAQNYFTSHKDEEFPDFHRRIASTCATYLCMLPLQESDYLQDEAWKKSSFTEDLYEGLNDILKESDGIWQRQKRSKHTCGLLAYPDQELRKRKQLQEFDESQTLPFEMKLECFPLIRYAGLYLGRHFRHLSEHTDNEDIAETIRPLLEKRPKRNFYLRLLTHLRTYHFRSRYYWYKESDLDSYAERWLDSYQMRCCATPSDLSEESMLVARSWEIANIPSESLMNHRVSQSLFNPSGSTSDDFSSSSDRSFHSKRSSLHLAVFLGCTSLVRHFIKEGEDVDALDEYGQSGLVLAVKGDHHGIITVLLEYGATIDLTTDEGHSLLLHAAQKDSRNTVQEIIRRAYTGETRSDTGMLKCHDDHWPLIAKYASFLLPITTMAHSHFINPSHRTISVRVTQDGKDDFVPKPLRRSPFVLGSLQPEELRNYTKLLSAAYNGDTGTMTNLIQSSDVVLQLEILNKSDLVQQTQARFVKTACFLAVERGHVQIMRRFLENLEDPNIQDYEGRTLLHRAVSQNCIEMAKLLLNKGVSPNLQDNYGLTAWTANARPHRAEILSLLRGFGANQNMQDSNGVNILYGAAAGGHVQDVEFLLKEGVDPSLQTKYGWAPLHWAAHNGRLECVRLLLDWGAELSPVSDQGTTPLDLARSNHQEVITDMLEKRGAETSQTIYARRGGNRPSYGPEDRPTYGHDLRHPQGMSMMPLRSDVILDSEVTSYLLGVDLDTWFDSFKI